MTEVPMRVNYQQRIIAVLKATAVSSGTISTGDLAWAIDYQRTTRPLTDLLAELRPLLEDHAWPPLTCLVVGPNRQPALEADRGMPAELRMRQRRCSTWAIESATERIRMRGQWAETVLGDAS
jgi:hypothetical protein